MSPGFMPCSVFWRLSEISETAMGPIRPPLAFDADAETSAATFAKSSPADSLARTSAARFAASSSRETLTPACPSFVVVGTSIRISRSVTDEGSVNSR